MFAKVNIFEMGSVVPISYYKGREQYVSFTVKRKQECRVSKP